MNKPVVNLSKTADLAERMRALNEIGIALSSEKNGERLLEKILEAARTLTNSDGGTLYIKNEEDCLEFQIMITESMGFRGGGASGAPIEIPPLRMFSEDGKPNLHNVSACAAVNETTINIADAYENTEFDFSGTRKFDESNNYRSKSFLCVPMMNHENELIGVLQLINAIDRETGDIKEFSELDQELVESLASQAAVALMNQRFIEEQRVLFESFIRLIAKAIDEKSPYTGGHCGRVPELTMMLSKAAARIENGPEEIRNFSMSEEDEYELWVAGMLHDCGKITTKEYVVDKATKLETKYDRVHTVDTRFEVLKRDAEIDMLKKQVAALQAGEQVNSSAMQAELEQTLAQLDEDREFLRQSNVGGEFMSDDKQARVKKISEYRWMNTAGEEENFLSENEVYNLIIPKGTLTSEEREHINHHIVATINMLEQLPYPKYLRKVPEYAGGHHERMDGKGYPRGLMRNEMSLQARAMGIADIFEALTAGDRPYKKAMPLSMALTILGRMKEEGHVDPDLFDVFIHEKIYMEYAHKFLVPEQIDDVDVASLPGYNANFHG